MSFAVGAMVVGTAFNAYSSYKAGKEAKEMADAQAAQQELQADELLRRAELNIEQIGLEGDQAISTARSTAGEGFFSQDLITMTAAHRRIGEAQEAALEDAEWQAAQIRLGADNTREQGTIDEKTGKTRAFGTLLSGAYSVSRVTGGTPK